MATFKSFNDLVVSFMEYLRVTQGNLDTKPGTVARDLFIDAPSQELAALYSSLRDISNLQSLFSVSGNNLAKLGANFGISKSLGTIASGTVTLTANFLDTDVVIPAQSVFIANNGITFKNIDTVVMRAASSNVYKANALRVKQDLLLANILDEYAIDVLVEAAITGSAGNIGRFSIVSANIDGISNVTNLNTFIGGTDTESDASYLARILAVFAGSNAGTSLGYETTINTIPGVSDSIVVVPGDTLMTRDGTVVISGPSGEKLVANPGTGGKVDVYMLGSRLVSEIDSFIYNDKSGRFDATDKLNDFIIGQGAGFNANKTVAQRRVEALANSSIPTQPVSSIISVAGSSSGANFAEKYTAADGSIRGNFELIKDQGDYSGSPFGFDKLHWISNKIEIDNEETIKSQYNGIDPLSFSNVQKIRDATQDIQILNENSTVSSTSRDLVSMLFRPIRTVSRVYNTTTGERYTIVDQNPDGEEGELNDSGRIRISGGTLPATSDTLQVDYTWVKQFDSNYEFDNLESFFKERTTQDSIDWGFGNLISNEPAIIQADLDGVQYVEVSSGVSRVLSVNGFSQENVIVSNGIITASFPILNILKLIRASDGAELFYTDAHDGAINNTINAILPTDTLAQNNDVAVLYYNAQNYFYSDGYGYGTAFENQISLPENIGSEGESVLVSYISDSSVILPETNISDLPATGLRNSFVVNSVDEIGSQPTTNFYDGLGNISYNLIKAPASLAITASSIPSNGTLTIAGITSSKISSAIMTVTSSLEGLTIDLSQAIKNASGLSVLGDNVFVSKIISVERVNVNFYGQVSSVDCNYDVINYRMLDNSYDLSNAVKDTTLSRTQVRLPNTANNLSATLSAGDILRVTFYYINTTDFESIYFSREGRQLSRKKYFHINKISNNFGFKNNLGIISGNVLVEKINQPELNSSYSVSYDYSAPKEGERITITYNYNALVGDATSAIERVRPITADVLIKEALAKSVDATISIVILPEYTNQAQNVIESAKDAVVRFLTADSLATTVDSSDIVNRLYAVPGIDRVTVVFFGISGEGNALSIIANRNEFLQPGNITINAESR